MTAANGRTEASFRVMRVDTAVNWGNIGGGLFDSDGNLIGIVNAKIVDESVENIGYAIPYNIAVSIAENINKTWQGDYFSDNLPAIFLLRLFYLRKNFVYSINVLTFLRFGCKIMLADNLTVIINVI